MTPAPREISYQQLELEARDGPEALRRYIRAATAGDLRAYRIEQLEKLVTHLPTARMSADARAAAAREVHRVFVELHADTEREGHASLDAEKARVLQIDRNDLARLRNVLPPLPPQAADNPASGPSLPDLRGVLPEGRAGQALAVGGAVLGWHLLFGTEHDGKEGLLRRAWNGIKRGAAAAASFLGLTWLWDRLRGGRIGGPGGQALGAGAGPGVGTAPGGYRPPEKKENEAQPEKAVRILILGPDTDPRAAPPAYFEIDSSGTAVDAREAIRQLQSLVAKKGQKVHVRIVVMPGSTDPRPSFMKDLEEYLESEPALRRTTHMPLPP